MENTSFKHIYYRCVSWLRHLIYSSELFQQNSLNLSKMIQKGVDIKKPSTHFSLQLSKEQFISQYTARETSSRISTCTVPVANPYLQLKLEVVPFLCLYIFMPQVVILFFLSPAASGCYTANYCFESQLLLLSLIQHYLVLDVIQINLAQAGYKFCAQL